MSEDDIRKIVQEELAKQPNKRIFQDNIIPSAVKRRHIDGTIITEGLAADKPTDGGAVGIKAWFSTDTGILYLWDGDEWLIPNGYADNWISFTPTLTNITVGNASLSGRYKVIGNFVRFQARIVLGSTSSMGSTPLITLPVTKDSSFNADGIIATARLYNNGVKLYLGGVTGTGEILSYSVDASAVGVTYTEEALLSATVPFTWGDTDSIYIEGSYWSA